jgi:subtilisin family serine protease
MKHYILFFLIYGSCLCFSLLEARDELVSLCNPVQGGLEGYYLTEHEIALAGNGTLQQEWQKKIDYYQKKINLSDSETVDQERLKKHLAVYNEIHSSLFWHQTNPHVGLRLQASDVPPPYPYLPHFFSLWELAPHKGKGSRVAMIDTGVAAFTIEGIAGAVQHKDLIMKYEWPYNYNVVSRGEKDALHELALLVYSYADQTKCSLQSLESELPSILFSYLKHKDLAPLFTCINRIGKRTLFGPDGQLNNQGKKALQAIVSGPFGIDPDRAHHNTMFHLAHVVAPFNTELILELLPNVQVLKPEDTFIAGHGSHTFGLVSGQCCIDTPGNDIGICGLAPAAETFMIKTFLSTGYTKKSTLIAALEKASMYKADIVNLSLKIADHLNLHDPSTRYLHQLLKQFPFVVCASGNEGARFTQQAYPARFKGIFFSVGAYACNKGMYTIPKFSQYDESGPHFVAPGQNIISSGLIKEKEDESIYTFMGGTSMAAPLVSGFLALILGEFKHDFTVDQIKIVCSIGSFKLHDTAEWSQKTTYGVIDMRTVLFMLHVLKKIKKMHSFDQHFTAYAEQVFQIITAPAQAYAAKYGPGVSFTRQFADYHSMAQDHWVTFKSEQYFKKEHLSNVDAAVTRVAALVKKQIAYEVY